MITTLPITKAREDLTTLVERANKLSEEYIITVNGSPAAVILSASEFDSWKETLAVLSDEKLLKAIKEGEKDLNEGKYITFDDLKEGFAAHV
jgi:prevent-host-death family protein